MEVLDHPVLAPIRKQSTNNPRVQQGPFAVKMMRLFFQLLGRLLPGPTAGMALRIFTKPRTRYCTKAFDGLLTKSRIFTVQSNGLEIHGRVWDNPGPTVLLVHGWETSGLHLGAFIEPLWSKGYKVVIFDGPAHGNSQGSHTNLPDFAEAMRVVIRKNGPVDHLIAHSLGGLPVFTSLQIS